MPSNDQAREGLGPFLPPATHPVRGVVWAIHLAVPLACLWLLLAYPQRLNVRWEHPPSHFWLIVCVAAVNFVLGLMINRAALQRRDARLFLVSLVFLSCAGFFLLHGLATPTVILARGSYGFDIGQPVGLTVAAVLAFTSSLPLGERAAAAVLKHGDLLRAGLVIVLVAWGFASLIEGLTPLSALPPKTGATIGVFSWLGAALYAVSAALMFRIHRRRPSAMLVSLITAYALLAEAHGGRVLPPQLALSWWEWHLLLTFAFGFVAYSAYVQFRREGSSAGLFDAVALAATVRRIRAEYGAGAGGAGRRICEPWARPARPPGRRSRPGWRASSGSPRARRPCSTGRARRWPTERELTARLAALVEVGGRPGWACRGGAARSACWTGSAGVRRRAHGARVATAWSSVGGPSSASATSGDRPITVGGVRGPPADRQGRAGRGARGARRHDRAGRGPRRDPGQPAVDHAGERRLYRELGTLFRQYMSPDVAAALLADPDQAALGGSLVELTALFADLQGLHHVLRAGGARRDRRMLNRYHAAAVPCILDNGGTIVQFVGDALLALFNAPARQADHALGRCARRWRCRRRSRRSPRASPGWPRLRVGANTGPALVGNIGSRDAARLQRDGRRGQRGRPAADTGRARHGGDRRRPPASDRLRRHASRPSGRSASRARAEPVQAYVLSGLSLRESPGAPSRSPRGGHDFVPRAGRVQRPAHRRRDRRPVREPAGSGAGTAARPSCSARVTRTDWVLVLPIRPGQGLLAHRRRHRGGARGARPGGAAR